MFGHLELGWRPSLIPNQVVWVSKINLKMRRVIAEGSGRAHSKAETLGSRFARSPEAGKQVVEI